MPAFVEFEPYSTKEGVGLRLIALAVLGTFALAGMAVRSIKILLATRKTQHGWRKNSQEIDVEAMPLPVYRVENAGSLLAVTGIFRPEIFVAREITEVLSPEELRAALAHEMAHVSSLDNLKQFLLKITRAPNWLKAIHRDDAGWIAASEIAADHDALVHGASVLDLSSALVKVGRLKRPPAVQETVSSHLVPLACSGALESRVTRLAAMLEGNGAAPSTHERRRTFFIPALIALALYLACINALLPAVHEALEFLVR